MGRPPLPIGGHGAIARKQQADGSWLAWCHVRESDGRTRRVKASGKSGQRAENALKAALEHRGGGDDINAGTRLKQLAEVWFRTVTKSPGTREAYRNTLDRHVVPKVGDLRVREATTARLDAFLQLVANPSVEKITNPRTGHVRSVKHGGPTAAKQCRTVLSLMMGMAARYDAVPTNPVRDTMLAAPKRKPVSALTVEQVHELRQDCADWVCAGTSGPRRGAGLLDMVDLFVATGLRPGELLGILFKDIDLRAGTVAVTGTIKRTRADGLHRQEYPKSEHGERVLRLPAFALQVVRERKIAAEDKAGLVFTSRVGGIVEPANFSRTWVAARGEKWGHVKPGAFRKAVATLIKREAGSDVAAAQLGHSSDEVTRRYYIEREKMAPDSTEILGLFRAEGR